jgi:hypothetical protein
VLNPAVSDNTGNFLPFSQQNRYVIPAHCKKASVLPVDIQGRTTSPKTSAAQYRVTGLVGMRAVVLLGLLAGATAFSGPSPVGERSCRLFPARPANERGHERGAARACAAKRLESSCVISTRSEQLCASAAAGGAACRAGCNAFAGRRSERARPRARRRSDVGRENLESS